VPTKIPEWNLYAWSFDGVTSAFLAGFSWQLKQCFAHILADEIKFN
jgi:hypothetical protein